MPLRALGVLARPEAARRAHADRGERQAPAEAVQPTLVAAALGGVADKDTMPWNVPLSVDVNYATGIDTMTNGTTGVLDIL